MSMLVLGQERALEQELGQELEQEVGVLSAVRKDSARWTQLGALRHTAVLTVALVAVPLCGQGRLINCRGLWRQRHPLHRGRQHACRSGTLRFDQRRWPSSVHSTRAER